MFKLSTEGLVKVEASREVKARMTKRKACPHMGLSQTQIKLSYSTKFFRSNQLIGCLSTP
jgi:hypothetical protein